jgi:hypothetical protein
MKRLMLRLVLVAVCAVACVACDKNEQIVGEQKKAPAEMAIVNYVPPMVVNNSGNFFRAIGTICPLYLQYTNKIGISNLQHLQIYDTFSDNNLSIYVELGLVKLNAAVKEEWNGQWNVPPYVESQNTAILQTVDDQPRRLVLSKKCYVFGFELGAYRTYGFYDPYDFTVTYSTRTASGSKRLGSVRQYIRQKNGARLFAIMSDTPIDEVYISFNRTGSFETIPENYAITNIRYLTNKEIYDAHKNDGQ